MTYSALRFSACTLALLLGSSAALAASGDVVTSVKDGPAVDPATLKELTNSLPAPDTSRARALGPDAGLKAGVSSGPATRLDRAFGSFGIPYTTTRVQLGNASASGVTAANQLSTTYPYRAVGKLTFNAGYCSASLIRRSVMVTAAHCFQRFGSGATTYNTFRFMPGHYGPTGATAAQIAPYGTWTTRTVARAATWANGTDVGSGSARDNDVALFIISRDGLGRFIGDTTGYMSYGWNNYSFVTSSKTGNLATAAVSTLGYPALMDSGRIMQRSDGPVYKTTVGGAKQLWQGSNFTGGSSGGPWVVNFSGRNPVLTGGAVPGSASTIAVVGVTSWGSADPNAIKDNYSSQFAQNSRYPNADYGGRGAGNIGSLMNTLCTSAAPEGGTYASQGYCN